MPEKEAKVRIKINKLPEEAGQRFFDDGRGKANIVLENNIKITGEKLTGFGEYFEVQGEAAIKETIIPKHGGYRKLKSFQIRRTE